jgi:acyl-CoA synthetase (AMP-forming)/AMP-acid ligase II
MATIQFERHNSQETPMTEKNYAPGECYVYPLILKKLLKTPLIYAPEKEIVYRDQSRYTYSDLNERIQRLAGGLHKRGVQNGEVVAVLDYDSPRYLECFFAIPMMGAVLQTVNWRLSSEQIVYTINHAEAKTIITHADFLPIIEAVQDQLLFVKTLIVIQEDTGAINSRLSIDAGYTEMLASALPSYDFPDLDENTKATTFYTTGTTGDPKGVYYSHRQLVLHALSVCLVSSAYHTISRFRSNDVYMPLTPMFHVHAWGFPFVATLMGAKQVYPGPYEPEKILKLIETEKVTFSHCVPTILQMVITHPLAKKTDLSNWKVVMGGAQLPKGLARQAMQFGIEIHAGYGMSETGPVMTTATPNESMLNWTDDPYLGLITKTGKPIPLAEIEVVDTDVQKLPHDGVTTGEVVMRSPWLTQSYFKAPDKTKELWRKGWLHSGDVGHMDEHGYLQITDRIKDVIKSGGEWVSSLDLENIMSQHEAVLESAAIGIPDKKWGERPMMIVTLKPEYQGKISAADFEAYMLENAKQGKLPKYGVPDRYEFVESIAKTSVGKLDKKVLRKLYSDKL